MAETTSQNEPKTMYPQYPWLGLEFFKNQKNFPWEELAPYEGQYVAFSWDGSKIVASGHTHEEVWAKLEAAGIDSNRVVFRFIELA